MRRKEREEMQIDKEQALERLRQLVNSNCLADEVEVTIRYESCPPKTDISLKNTYRDNGNALGYRTGIPPYRIETAD